MENQLPTTPREWYYFWKEKSEDKGRSAAERAEYAAAAKRVYDSMTRIMAEEVELNKAITSNRVKKDIAEYKRQRDLVCYDSEIIKEIMNKLC